MGYRLTKFQVTPGKNEQIELTVKLQEEQRSVIHGIVLDCNNKPLKDAVVKLFEVNNPCDPCSLIPITHAFTDECGQFLFGPLTPNKKYVIKVWHSHVTIRPVVIKPDQCDPPHPHNQCDDDFRSGLEENFIDEEEK